jgi:hypothetical protein
LTKSTKGLEKKDVAEVQVLGNESAKATSIEIDASKDKDLSKDTYARKAKGAKNKDKNEETGQQSMPGKEKAKKS